MYQMKFLKHLQKTNMLILTNNENAGPKSTQNSKPESLINRQNN